jgi:hypothetical protein
MSDFMHEMASAPMLVVCFLIAMALGYAWGSRRG